MSQPDRARVEESLRRVEALVASLGELQDPRARTLARELAETVLDMHGLALARFAAGLCATKDGPALFNEFARDEAIKAVLLLHGLHPDDPQTRIRAAVEALRPSLARQGARIALIAVADGVARLSLDAAGMGEAEARMLCRDIERAVSDAAPDVEEVVIAVEAANRPPVALAS